MKVPSNFFAWIALPMFFVFCGDGSEARKSLITAIVNKNLKRVSAYQIRQSFKRNNIKAKKVYLNKYVALTGGRVVEMSDYEIELGLFGESELSKELGNLSSQYGGGNVKKQYTQVGTIECDMAQDEKNKEYLSTLKTNQKKTIYGKIIDLSKGIFEDITIEISGCFLYKPKK